MKFLEKPFFYKIRYGLIVTYLIAIVLFWDIFFKIVTYGFDVEIIKGFFWFTSVENRGAAFGIFQNSVLPLIFISIIFIIGIILFNWFYTKKTIFYSISVGLVLGGALGNLVDRVFLGYVRDFIKFSFFEPVFNIADICLCVGVLLFAIHILFLENRKSKSPKEINNIVIVNDGESE